MCRYMCGLGLSYYRFEHYHSKRRAFYTITPAQTQDKEDSEKPEWLIN